MKDEFCYYIQLEEFRDGYEITHHCVTVSEESDPIEALHQYAKNFFYDDEPSINENGHYVFGLGEMEVKPTKVAELTKEQYELMNHLFYGS